MNVIYIRERGQLRHNGLHQTAAESVSCRPQTRPLLSKREHFVFVYNAEGSLRYSAKSLFDISLLFVADNVRHVDSLRGFPEQMGEKLFAAAEERLAFSHADAAARALRVFGDAYGELVLGSLCLRNSFCLLSERMDEIRAFRSLKSLDLFGCRLGDSHEIFQHLTSNSLVSLINLFIGGNGMSDVGLQRLTAPVRILKKGLNNLQLLDLSYNPISERGIGYLTCLSNLQNLDVSGTNLKLSTVLKKTMRDLTGLVQSERPLDVFDHSRCTTEGWAQQVINQWETNAMEMPKQKKIEGLRASAICFYGRKRVVHALDAPPLILEKEEDAKREWLHFYRPAVINRKPEVQQFGKTNDHTETSCCNVKKRQQQPACSDSLHQSSPAKRFSSSAVTAEDMDLLNTY
ncbi:leucine-rich repeat-containing protein 42 isoform X1 [Lampris incognitus]|uniref:leucine-rich repeat-containing protein 42 isoform X1 n=1 Tax=Lampris incognitus TaxID=2546036 RepID=UPI0024B5F9A6|nr:leucine-rich repeat-containing protein 42 isoform X1 [Lampris incognitus]